MKAFIFTLLAALPCFATEGPLFTLGVDTRCLYGLTPCWAKVREPVSLTEGVAWVSEQADSLSWTGQFRTHGGRLPDLAALRAQMHKFNGDQFTVRGVEAALEGKVSRRAGVAIFKMNTGEELTLAPLARKVQWDPKTRADFPTAEAERSAFSRLRERLDNSPRAARITGPLTQENGRWQLEVREFSWR